MRLFGGYIRDKVRVALDINAYMPVRAHKTDAGADLRSPVDAIIPAHSSVIIDTGIHIQLPHGTVGMVKSKSGLYIRGGITCEGVIDEGYTGSIMVKLINHSDHTHYIDKGDKITQLVIVPCVYADFVPVAEVSGSDRGSNGFGSTGK